jgi:hypothetical protein
MAREKLTRAEQRYNYGLAVAAVAFVVVVTLVSDKLIIGVLVGAFLFGLGQMVIGLTRRRRYLRSLETPAALGLDE